MASLAIHRHLLAGIADVFVVVATEATGRNHVADVVGVGAPTDFHFREKVLAVDLFHLLDRRLDFRRIFRIFLAQSGLNRRQGLFLGLVFAVQQVHRMAFDVFERRVNQPRRHRLVHRALRRMILVAGPVMAVDAIHRAYFRFGENLRILKLGEKLRVLRVRALVHHHRAIGLGLPDPRNFQPFFIRGDVFITIVHHHVPVNPLAPPMPLVAAADIDQHLHGPRIIFAGVGAEIGAIHQDRIKELFRPVAGVACFLGRTQVMHRRRDRAAECIKRGVPDLAKPIHF